MEGRISENLLRLLEQAEEIAVGREDQRGIAAECLFVGVECLHKPVEVGCFGARRVGFGIDLRCRGVGLALDLLHLAVGIRLDPPQIPLLPALDFRCLASPLRRRWLLLLLLLLLLPLLLLLLLLPYYYY